MRPFLNPRFLTIGSSSLWVSSALDGDPNLHLLADPDLLLARPDCRIIKDQRKIKVGFIRMELGGKLRGIYLKRYNAFSWRYRLVSLFVPSAAKRSWAGAGALLRAGFFTGEPIAAVECRSWGMLTKSFYLSAEVEEGRTADAYWREKLVPLKGKEGFRGRRNFLKMLALLFRSLHMHNIYHNDLKDANILVASRDHGAESFYLMDLEGIRRYRGLVGRRRVKNLVQLNRTMGRAVSRSARLYFLKEYLGDGFSSRRERQRWVKRILKKSEREDRRSLRKTLQDAA